MKRSIAFLILILVVLSMLHSISAGDLATDQVQTIAGYIQYNNADYVDLTVSLDALYSNPSKSGINLDVASPDNPNRFIISPSMAHDLGLRIGTFNLEATNTNYVLFVYHSKMRHTTVQNTYVDYELGLSYTLADGTLVSDYCISVDNASSVNIAQKTTSEIEEMVTAKTLIELDLGDLVNGVILVQRGGIYFRLAELATVSGKYESDITFVMGTK